MLDVMVDLETLGTLPGSVILSIGAVAFDEFETGAEFYTPISRIDSEQRGFKVSPKTEKWWEDQSPEARLVLNHPGAISAYTAFAHFNQFLTQFPDDVRIWGNGANFDNPLLAAGFDIVGLTPKYQFWNERCYRTVKNQFPAIKLRRTGTYHNALDDARCQARHLIEICQKRDWRLR